MLTAPIWNLDSYRRFTHERNKGVNKYKYAFGFGDHHHHHLSTNPG